MRHVTKITLKAKNERPYPPMISRDQEFAHGYSGIVGVVSDMLTISDISLRDWEVRYKIRPLSDFEKVSQIVGPDKAARVMEVLSK